MVENSSDGILGKSSTNDLRDKSSSGVLGNLIGSEYGDKTEEFKLEFARVKDEFNRGVGIEIFKIVHGGGTSCSIVSYQ